MYTYNDSMWLSDRFREYAAEWNSRTDLPPRTYGKVKLGPEIKALQSFGKRAYTNEMISQRTIINDLMGGAYFRPLRMFHM
jgi:protein transport protein DSL1/ZW10